jgi:hypothetical protein
MKSTAITNDQYRQQFRTALYRIETSSAAEFTKNVRWVLARISFQSQTAVHNQQSEIRNPPSYIHS